MTHGLLQSDRLPSNTAYGLLFNGLPIVGREQVSSLPPGTYLRNRPLRGIEDNEWILPVHQNFMKVTPSDPFRPLPTPSDPF